MSNLQLSHAAYNAFMDCECNLIDRAVADAVFTEEDSAGFSTSPVVIVRNEKDLRFWDKKVREWQRLAQVLHLSAPSKFPENSKLFSPPPLILTGVTACTLATVEAVSSQPITKERILKSLKNQLAVISRSRRLIDLGEDESIKNAIEYFTQKSEKNYRLRRSGYSCLRATLTLTDGSHPLQIVSHRGLFLYSGNPEKATAFSLSKSGSRPRKSAYDLIDPIPINVGLVGDLYSQTEVNRAKATLNKEYESRRFVKKTT